MDIIDYFNRKDNSNINKQNLNNILHSCGLNLTEEQMNIITTNHDNIMVNGVPGSAKTTTLVLRQAYKITQKQKIQNTIFLTQVSNVTEELVKRLQSFIPDIKFKYSSTSRVTTEYNGHSLEFSNYDGFIDSQLRHHIADPNNPDHLEYEINGKKYKKLLGLIGQDFELKKKIFNQLAKSNKLTFKLKNGKPINKIILDEVQDFSQTIALVFLSIINNNEISFEGYGDILQSIWFSHSKNKELNQISPYPINIFRTIKDIKLLSLSMSFRIPWWHGEFLRIINKGANKLYCRDEIRTWKEKPTENKDLHKPMYFMHGKMGSNEEASHTAKQIYKILTTTWNDDKTVTYGDATITSTNVNNNAIFNKLESLLLKNNIPVVFFKTKSCDSNITIDMNLLKEEKCSNCGKKFNKKSTNCKKCGAIRKRNKVALISGHGFKGGESKLVIAFGLSEKAIPRENHPNTPNELKDISLMEVLCSRSKKYLFIGSNYSPTRYITNHMLELSNVLYLVQDFQNHFNKEIKKTEENGQFKLSAKIQNLNKFYAKKEIDKIIKLKDLPEDKSNENKHLNFLKKLAINDIEKPEIYNKVSQVLMEYNKKTDPDFNNPLYNLLKKTKGTLNTPDRNILSVTDITEKVNEYNSTYDIFEKCIETETETFGEACSVKYTSVDAPTLLGNLPNIKISMYYDFDFCKCLKRIIDDQNIIYIKEDKYLGLIDILKDNFKWYEFLEGLDMNTIMDKISDNQDYRTQSGQLRKKYRLALKYVAELFGYRNKDSKQILLPSYFSDVFYNMELNTNTQIWNQCLLYEYIYSNNYVQSSYKINNASEYFTGDLTNAMKNIDFFIHNEKGIKIEIPCNEKTINERNEEILKNQLLFNPIDNGPVFRNGYECCIRGRVDGYIGEYLHEFKMSMLEKCKKDWKLQVLLYSDMGIEERLDANIVASLNIPILSIPKKKIFFKNAILHNFITGEKYTFKINLDLFKEKYKRRFHEEMLDSFNYIPCLKNKFLDAITRN